MVKLILRNVFEFLLHIFVYRDFSIGFFKEYTSGMPSHIWSTAISQIEYMCIMSTYTHLDSYKSKEAFQEIIWSIFTSLGIIALERSQEKNDLTYH